MDAPSAAERKAATALSINDLEDLIMAADHTDWDAKDWQWDPVTLTAVPRHPPTAQISRSTPVLEASMHAQQMAATQEPERAPQRAPAPAMSCSSGDSQAMLAHATGDAADSPAAAEPAVRDQGLQVAALATSDPGSVVASLCGAMHKPAMAALLCGQPAKGVPDAIEVMGIGQHKSGGDPSRWRDVQPAGGPVEAQVWMMTGANLEADVYGRSRDEDYQAESPAPSNQGSEDGESGDTLPVRQYNGGNGGGGGTIPTCQVEKCRKELIGLTTYHQRCRICEVHIKMPEFDRAGKRQRFCQQCGRCHLLDAFDQGKRSCRAQLAKHNARRRKRLGKDSNKADYRAPRPASTTQRKGAADSDYSPPEPHRPKMEEAPTGSGSRAARGRRGNRGFVGHADISDDEAMDDVPRYGEGTGYHGRSSVPGHPLQAGRNGGGSMQMRTSSMDPAADAMLALAQRMGSGSGSLPRQDYAPLRKQPGSGSLNNTGGGGFVAGMGVGRIGAAASEDLMQRLGQDMFNPLTPYQSQASMPLPPALTASFAGSNPTEQMNTSMDMAMALIRQQQQQHGPSNGVPNGLPGGTGPPIVRPATGIYTPETHSVRLSIKLFNCTPENLPSDLRDQLTSWMSAMPGGMEGYLRPGCVHVTVQAIVDSNTREASVAGGISNVMRQLIQRDPRTWGTRVLLVQLHQEVALVRNGDMLHVWTLAELAQSVPAVGSPALPRVFRIDPVCLSSMASAQVVNVLGFNVTGEECVVLVRAGGEYLPATCLPLDPALAAYVASMGLELVHLQLPPEMEPGLIHVEVQKGAFLGEAQPVLVMREGPAREQVQSAVEKLKAEHRAAFLADVGIAVQTIHRLCKRSAEPPVAVNVAVAVARRLVSFATERGLWALAAFMLPLASRGAPSVPALLESIDAVAADGWGLLHKAVLSGDILMAQALIEYAKRHGHVLAADQKGPMGVTQLHLAALLPDGGTMAELLVLQCLPGPVGWFIATTDDGKKPAQFAASAGHGATNATMMALLSAGSGPPTTASGPPPCEAFDAAFANGCVDCTCESGARGITDSLLPRSDRDSGGSGDGKRDNTQYTISAQATGSGTIYHGAPSGTTAGQTDTSSVNGSGSRSNALTNVLRLPPRVNTPIAPAATVASLAAVAGMGHSGSDLRLGPFLPDRAASTQPAAAAGASNVRSNSWQLEEEQASARGGCCGGKRSADDNLVGGFAVADGCGADAKAAAAQCCGMRRRRDQLDGGDPGPEDADGSAIKYVTGASCGAGKGAGQCCGTERANGLSLDLHMHPAEDSSKRCKTQPGSPRLHKARRPVRIPGNIDGGCTACGNNCKCTICTCACDGACDSDQVAKKEADAAGILLGLSSAGISTDDVPVPPPVPSIDANGQPCRCTALRTAAGAAAAAAEGGGGGAGDGPAGSGNRSRGSGGGDGDAQRDGRPPAGGDPADKHAGGSHGGNGFVPRGIAVCAPSQAAINADVAEAPGNESSVLTENADAALNTLAAGTVEGYPATVPQDRAAARARSAEVGLAASAKQLLAEAAAEALRAQARLLVSQALARSAAAEALSAQAGLALHGSPLAGITNFNDSHPSLAVAASLAKLGRRSTRSASGQPETCVKAALAADACGVGSRLDRLAWFGRQGALACVTTCLAAVQGMPWMM